MMNNTKQTEMHFEGAAKEVDVWSDDHGLWGVYVVTDGNQAQAKRIAGRIEGFQDAVAVARRMAKTEGLPLNGDITLE